jgi:hypothetical protein
VVFSECTALEALCLPASLAVLSEGSLSGMSFLKSLTFESGSKLKEIHASAFSGCETLKSICILASVSLLDGAAFIRSSIEEILVDAANPHYFVSGPFLIGVDGMTLIRYFGHQKDLEPDSLSDLGLRQIGRNAFSECPALKSIFIPACIEILRDFSFVDFSSLTEIIFESGSQLSQMGMGVFADCSSLVSVCIPAKVKKIPVNCFCSCTSLVEISFEPDAKLTRIKDRAFLECHSLRSLAISGQLEIMAYDMFVGCTSVCELVFDLPSRLKQLDLPPSEFGSLCVPYSVEVVFGNIGKRDGQHRLLQFSRKSRLMRIEVGELSHFWDPDANTEGHSFAALSEEVLRRFRCQIEYS